MIWNEMLNPDLIYNISEFATCLSGTTDHLKEQTRLNQVEVHVIFLSYRKLMQQTVQ